MHHAPDTGWCDGRASASPITEKSSLQLPFFWGKGVLISELQRGTCDDLQDHTSEGRAASLFSYGIATRSNSQQLVWGRSKVVPSFPDETSLYLEFECIPT